MTLTTKQQIIIVIIIGATGVATGRFLAPAKIVTQVKTVEVAKSDTKTSDKTKTHTHKDTTTVIVKKPDGTQETTTKTVVDTNTGNDVAVDTHKSDSNATDSKTEKTSQTGHLNLSFLAGANPFNQTTRPGLVYGGHVTRDIIGPVNIGIWALSDGTCGLSAGLTF